MKTRPGPYDPSVIDTFYIVGNEKSKLSISINPSDSTTFITDADIQDNSLKIKGEIKIGSKYDEILKQIAPSRLHKVKSKIIYITNDDGAINQLILFFKEDVLVRITYNPYSG